MLKAIWGVPNVHDSISITLESDTKKGTICTREITFPDRSNGIERHTVNISSFTPEDINMFAQFLDTRRTDHL